jgi:hypothetical protein
MFNKVTSRSYSYFLKFFILFLVEKWIPPTRSEAVEIGQKTEGILGVKVRPLMLGVGTATLSISLFRSPSSS